MPYNFEVRHMSRATDNGDPSSEHKPGMFCSDANDLACEPGISYRIVAHHST